MSRHSFIPRNLLKPEFQNDDAKYAVNIYLMTKANKNIVADFDEQHLALTYADEINAFETIEDICKNIKDYVERFESPSKLAGWIVSLQQLFGNDNLEWLQIPKHEMEENRLCCSDFSEPPLAIVHYLNHLSPQFCGYYFENILHYCIHGLTNTEWKVELCGNDKSISFSAEDIKLLEKQVPDTIPGKILLETIKQYVNKKIEIESYTAIYKFIDAVKEYAAEIETYISKLSTTGYVIKNKAHTEYKHSVNVEGRYHGLYQHGEMDFLIGKTIIDAKACKQIHLEEWFMQLNIYRELYDIRISKMEIVSFLNNRIYRFSIQ